MPKPRIALLVATPLRDLAGLVLTARALCQRGAVCYLVPQVDGFAEIWALAPDFVLVPAFRSYYAPRVRRYLDVGIQYGLLDTEQSVYRSPAEYRSTMWDQADLFRAARCACMWGPAIARDVVAHGLFNDRQIVVTGCPRFDFYAGALGRVYGEIVGPYLPGSPRSILINTNFTIANYADSPFDRLVENMSRNYGHPRELILEWYRIQRSAMASMIDLARRLAGDFPRFAVVVRPHPQELEEPYQEGAQGFENLHVIKDGPVTPWIKRALTVVQRSCTTAVEAALAGLPALSPRWIPMSHEYPLPEAMSIPLQGYEPFRDTVDAIAAGHFRYTPAEASRIENLTAEWLHRNDGLAHERVAEAILGSLDPTGRVDRKGCRRLLHGLHNEPFWTTRGFGNRLRYALDLPHAWSFRALRTRRPAPDGAYFQVDEVGRLASAIDAVQNGKGPAGLRIRKATHAGAYLTPKFHGRSIVLESA
jgi:surface carbohydrate biosynthesis protein